jgi:hypothetical protein
VGAALAWRNRHWAFAGRVYITVIAVTALEFVWFLNHWNLLGFRL